MVHPSRIVERSVERLERAPDRSKTSGAMTVVDLYGGVAGFVASRVFSRLAVGAVFIEAVANANVVGDGPG